MPKLMTGVMASVIALTTAASAAGPDVKYRTPRTESGQPDLRGVWNFSSDVPLQRPAAFAERKVLTREEFVAQRNARRNVFSMIRTFAPVEAVGFDWLDDRTYVDDLRTSLITYPENGRLPKLVDGIGRRPGVDEIIDLLANSKGGALPPELVSLLAAFQAGKRDGYEDFSAGERCLFGANAPIVPNVDSNYVHVIQSKDHVALLTDANRRIIALDGKPNLSPKIRSWSGDARGHWDGDTLVVETRNFNKRPQSFAGAGNAYDKVVIERFTRNSVNTLVYEATISDATTFQDKIVLSYPMAKVDARTYEWACHEGNYSLPNTLSGARAEERVAAKAR